MYTECHIGKEIYKARETPFKTTVEVYVPVSDKNQSFSSWLTDQSTLEFKQNTTYATLSNYTQSTELSKYSIDE